MSEKRIIITDADTMPPIDAWGWERGLDPMHEDAFPREFKYVGTGGKRSGCWFKLDGYGNAIGYVVDGTRFEVDADEYWELCCRRAEAVMNEEVA